MMVSPRSEESERAVALLLSHVLAEGEAAQMLDAGSEAGGDRLAATASRLYREAGRLIAGRVDFEPTAVDYALAVIFDVADACALASAESTQYPWPTRRVIELEIRLYELADWATRLGFTLDLRYVEEGFPAEAMRADEL